MSKPTGESLNIPFTQYLRPNGRRTTVWFENDDPTLAAKATELQAAGFRFECEHLRTGHASFTIVHPSYDCDLAIEVVPNGPPVVEAVQRLITNFNPAEALS
jgi:hypothetical protein